MKKLRLELSDLSVDTFETVAHSSSQPKTVFGQSIVPETGACGGSEDYCTQLGTCDPGMGEHTDACGCVHEGDTQCSFCVTGDHGCTFYSSCTCPATHPAC